jgi:tRNA 2-thiocytidine biosynthesis protein TtcA
MIPILSSLPIAKPPWTGLGKRLESLCRKALLQFDMLEGASTVAVALSGGKDSLTLLYLLDAIRGRGFAHFNIVAIHVGGSFSCGAGISGSYLKGICNALNIPLIVEQAEEQQKLECYSCSRERRKLIFSAAKKNGATVIAFGHHKDDSNQTLLMNLLHKAEFSANLPKVPMHNYGITIIRPLIYLLEKEIDAFASLYGYKRITCQCPIGQHSMRKKAAELLGEIQRFFPNASHNLFLAGMEYGSKKALFK